MIDTAALKNNILELAFKGELISFVEGDGCISELIQDIPSPSNKRLGLLKKGSDTVFPYTLPDNWEIVPLGKITSYGDTPTKIMASDVESDTWILELEDIEAGGRLLKRTRVGSRQAIGEKTTFNRGQVLYSKLRPYLKKVLQADEDGICTPELIAFDVYAGINPRYIMYYLICNFVDKVINQRSYGVKMPRVDAQFMVNLPVPLPTIAVQNKIVDIIDEAFSAVETINKLQVQYSSDLEVLKSKIIDAGVQGKLTEQLPEDGTAEELLEQIAKEKKQLIKEKKIKATKALPEITEDEIPFEIPENWKWVRLADICSKITSGNTPAGGSKGGAYVTEGNCFFREQNIYNDGIHYKGMVYITDELLATRENSTVLPQDILLNITGGSIGRCALIPDDFSKGSINQHILIIRVIEPEIRQYIHKCLCSPYYQKLIMGNVVGDKDGFSAGRCKNTLIPLPPIGEQKRIVEKITQILEQI